MYSVSPPATRQPGRSGEQQHQPPPTGDATHTVEKSLPFVRRRGVVAEHDSRAAGEAIERRPECIFHALVGHQPQGRQRLAAMHVATYSGAMPPLETAADRLAEVRQRVAHTAKLAGRDPDTVELIAVSKTQPVEAILPLIAAGQRSFGENRVQEAQAKWASLRPEYPDLRLHLVGQLQSNKAAAAIALFDAIHSLDRPSLLEALSVAVDKARRCPELFIQIDIGEEPQKGGCAPGDLPALLVRARDAGLPVAGLMAVPPAGREAAPYFALLAKLAHDAGLARLSIGMSDDFEVATMLGATQIRVGTALFGSRN